jgi:type II secretory pathway pseudopilin PulG
MKRRAFSLVELLAVLSGCAVVLALTASLIHQAMRSQSHTRRFFDVERNAQRLTRQFRADVHRALRATGGGELKDEEGEFTLHFAEGQSAVYRRSAQKVIRTASTEEEPSATEEFSLNASMHMRIEQQENPPQWALTIHTDPPTPSKSGAMSLVRSGDTLVHLHVAAALGRDRRYAPPAPESEAAP